jgi:glycosyltransferase involved in cell wall biosynthesis
MTDRTYVLTPRPLPALLSLVIPMYNEEEAIPLLRKRVAEAIAHVGSAVEVIVVDDGSTDRTLSLLLEWAKEVAGVKVLGLARNFGHQFAATAGLDYARGDAVVLMDADLQDPPEIIGEMVGKYCQGYDVIYGQRNLRQGETAFKRVTAWVFYRAMRGLVHKDLPPDTGDFRLMSRACLDALKGMRETHRFLRGMVAWVGFAQTAVRFDRPPRVAGRSKYPPRKMLRFAWNAVLSFSPLPLRISLVAGLLSAAVGLGLMVYAIVAKVIWQNTTPGWTSEVVAVTFIGGMVLVSNGILGEYVGRIFEEIKGRPLYVVSRWTGDEAASGREVKPTPPDGHSE